MTVSFYTLGCKLNQVETEGVARAFQEAGFSVASYPEPALITIVNTCTVTSKSEQKARRVIRKILRDNPAGVVIATGCYVQMDEMTVASLAEERLITLPLDFKDRLMDLPLYLRQRGEGAAEATGDAALAADLMRWAADVRQEKAALGSVPGLFRYNGEDQSFHSRVFLKIQDGCSNACAYCRVTLARGKPVSLEADRAIALLGQLSERGAREVVLTGINLACYRSQGLSLGGLLRRILTETEGFRLRLTSLEPEMITPELVEVLGDERIAPHFHLSLQSGSDAILRRMGRRYLSDVFRRGVRELRRVSDLPFLSADVIAGFPGEGEDEFRETLALIEETRLSGLHVFPFSPRPGTRAAEMRPQVPQRIIGERTALLREAARRASADFIESLPGRGAQVLIEGPAALPEGSLPGEAELWRGTSGRYQEVHVPADSFPGLSPGDLCAGFLEASPRHPGHLLLSPS